MYNSKAKFKELEQGDTFYYGEHHLMKIANSSDKQAVYLSGENKGWLCYIHLCDVVRLETGDRRKGEGRRLHDRR